MGRRVLVALKERFAGNFKERFKCRRLFGRLQATQVVPIDRRCAAFGYNLNWNGRAGQASNRGAKNLMSSEHFSQRRF